MTNTDHDVIVIGAGAAGIAATRALTEAGHDVICLEAEDRVGGRAHTDTDIFGVPFDMGAHWMHCAHVNALKASALAMGFDIYPESEDGMVHGAGTNAELWDPVDAMFATTRAAAEADRETERRTGHPTDRALADVLDVSGPWALSVRMLSCLSMGRDPNQISLRDMSTWEGGRNLFCREGFGAIVARLAEGLPIRLSSPVTRITVKSDHVAVATAETSLTAGQVIVTASIGVLAEEVIGFDPPLDAAHRKALEMITMGDYNHTALRFTPGTLPVTPDTWLSYRIDTEVAGIPQGGGFMCDISGTGLTCFETGGSFSRDLQAAGADAAIDHALETLAGIFGTDIRKGFLKGHATAWRQEPFVRGSYSGALPGGSDQREVLRRPHAGRVHFAGEATHRGQQATVSGAWLEGQRAAGDARTALAP